MFVYKFFTIPLILIQSLTLLYLCDLGVSSTWNRDRNAARNLFKIFKYMLAHDGEVPVEFRQETVLEEPVSCRYRYAEKTRKKGDGQAVRAFAR